jgi:hypothetical protein
MAVVIESELECQPDETSLPTPSPIRFVVSLSNTTGPSTVQLTFSLSEHNDLSFKPLGPGSPPAKKSSATAALGKTAKKFPFSRKVYAPPNTDLAAFRVFLAVEGTEGTSCWIAVAD